MSVNPDYGCFFIALTYKNEPVRETENKTPSSDVIFLLLERQITFSRLFIFNFWGRFYYLLFFLFPAVSPISPILLCRVQIEQHLGIKGATQFHQHNLHHSSSAHNYNLFQKDHIRPTRASLLAMKVYLFDLNLAREKQMKARYCPCTKIVTRPWFMPA